MFTGYCEILYVHLLANWFKFLPAQSKSNLAGTQVTLGVVIHPVLQGVFQIHYSDLENKWLQCPLPVWENKKYNPSLKILLDTA
jgi:hypothetical protein